MRSILRITALPVMMLAAACGTGCSPDAPEPAEPGARELLSGGPMPLREAERVADNAVSVMATDEPLLRQRVKATILKLLAHPDPSVRVPAARELGILQTAAPGEALLLACEDPSAEVRVESAAAVGRCGTVDLALPLAASIDDESAAVRLNIARSLGRLRVPATVGPLVGVLLSDSAAAVRTEAARSLGAIGDSSGTAHLLKALGTDPSPRVRAAAAGSLGLTGDRAVLPHLAAALEDESPLVRYLAVGAIGTLGDRSSAAAVERLKTDPDATVRRAAEKIAERLQSAGE